MSKAFFDLPSRIEDGFAKIDSDIMIDLRDTNEEYAILQKQLSELKQQHPFIDKIMEGDGAINLTADEHDVFLRYLHLYAILISPRSISTRHHSRTPLQLPLRALAKGL